MNLGLYSLGKGDYRDAQAMFEKAVELAPRNSYAYMLRGYFWLLLERDDQALLDLSKSISLGRSPYGLFYRGELHRKMGNYDNALIDYQSALQLNPHFTGALYGIALVFWEKEEIAKATEACRELVKSNRHDSRGYLCLGSLLMEQNLLEDALKTYQQGVARVPNDSELWHQMGITYQKSSMDSQAAEAFGRATALMQKQGGEARASPPVN